MADTPVTLPQINQQFLDFLKQFPAEMAKLIAIIKEFYKQANTAPGPALPPGTVPSGPGYVYPNQPPVLTTVPITEEDLDAMMNSRADQLVIEKGLIAVRAFVMGLMMGAGI